MDSRRAQERRLVDVDRVEGASLPRRIAGGRRRYRCRVYHRRGRASVGIGVGYAAYLVLAKGESPMKALGDAISWEQGELKRATRTSSNE